MAAVLAADIGATNARFALVERPAHDARIVYGLYVCGGIAAKLAPRLAAGDFLAAFNDKGRHRDLVASIPVRVVTNEKLGLLGAARAASA